MDLIWLIFISFHTIFLILQSVIWIWLKSNFWKKIQLVKTLGFKKLSL